MFQHGNKLTSWGGVTQDVTVSESNLLKSDIERHDSVLVDFRGEAINVSLRADLTDFAASAEESKQANEDSKYSYGDGDIIRHYVTSSGPT